MSPKPRNPRPMSDLVHAHLGRPGVAVGGGMSLPKQIALAPAGAVYVAANQHACVMGYPCDYIVSIDPDGFEKSKSFGKPIITPRRWGDYQIFRNSFNSSGVLAAWCLWVMGCAPIIVTAMDCFVGGTYCHDPKAISSGTGASVDQHLRKWTKLLTACPQGAFRSAGGPTLKLFPAFDPVETGFRPATRVDAMRAASGIVIEVKDAKDFLAGRKQGERIEVSESEARHAVGKRFAVKIAGALPA